MAQVLTGTFQQKADFTLYTNNNTNGQNVRIIFNYLSIEGTGTNEMIIRKKNGELIQIPNINDQDNVFMEGIIGKNLSANQTNYGWYHRTWWGTFDHVGRYAGNWSWYSYWKHPYWAGYGKDFGNWRGASQNDSGSHPNGYMFATSNKTTNFYGWRVNNRLEEVPFPNEIMLADGDALIFKLRTVTTVDWKRGQSVGPEAQYITYNVLAIPENG
jgi:hypothetical protein